jgi:hypothetical protein
MGGTNPEHVERGAAEENTGVPLTETEKDTSRPVQEREREDVEQGRDSGSAN